MTPFSTVKTTGEKWEVLAMRFCPVGIVTFLSLQRHSQQRFAAFRSYQNRAVFNNILPTIQNVYTSYTQERYTKITLLARQQAGGALVKSGGLL